MMQKTLGFVLVICFCAGLSYGQKGDVQYVEMWDKVEQFKNQGRPVSAMEIVNEILNLSEQDKNEPQRIKALIHRIGLRQVKEEDAILTSLRELENELQTGTPIAKAILHSALAEMLWWYYQGNLWTIGQRLSIEDDLDTNITTWSADRFIQAVTVHYQASLSPEKELQNTKAGAYDAIWETNESGRTVRPTLYDVLVHRALEHFTRMNSGRTLPINPFSVNDVRYFTTPRDFTELTIQHPDTVSYAYRSLQIWQELLVFHLSQKNGAAVIYNHLDLLEFVHQQYNLQDKDERYFEALQSLTVFNTEVEETALAFEAMAQLKYNQGSQYNSQQPDATRWLIREARDICLKCEKKYPGSNGANGCANLRGQIEQPALSLHLPEVTDPDKPFLGLLNVKNANHVYFRIVNGESILRREMTNAKHYDVHHYLQKEVLKRVDLAIGNPGDFQHHSMEISFDGLPPGQFVILSSLKEDFSTVDNIVTREHIVFSELAYFHTNNDDKLFHVVNRTSGQPLKGVVASLFEEQYKQRQRILKTGPLLTSDEMGRIKLPEAERNLNYRVILSSKKDTLEVSDRIYVKQRRTNIDEGRKFSNIFTDRSIYRPGQRVYFKGILMKHEGRDTKVVAGESVEIKLIDVNNQEVEKKTLVTREDGSYEGVFNLPLSGLTGNFSIQDGVSYHSISVEEYKRPTYEVLLSQPENSYRLNDTVSLKGTVKAFNGTMLENATGRYNVVRRVFHPVYWNWFHMWPVRNTAGEIAHGSFTTAEDGTFNIQFKALPPPGSNLSHQVIFSYEVEVIVTDVNGEVRETTLNMPVSNRALVIGMDLKEDVEMDELQSVKVISSNLNGTFLPAEIKIKLTALKSPDQVYRDRLWAVPDTFVMEEAEFRKKHPLDPYGNENELANWKKGDVVFSGSINTADVKTMNLRPHVSGQGAYLIELSSTDKYGSQVNWEKRLVIYDHSKKKIPVPVACWFEQLPDQAKVGDSPMLWIGTGFGSGQVYISERNLSGTISSGWMKVGEDLSGSGASIGTQDRGGRQFNMVFVRHGRIYQHSHTIDVPYDNKELKIGLETFRTELLPGSKEKWTLSIVDSENKPFGGYVTASMYDASLDVFKPHNWSFSPFQKLHYYGYWLSGNCFQTTSSQAYNFLKTDHFPIRQRRFDRFNWFGFRYYGGGFRSFEMENSDIALSTQGNISGLKAQGLNDEIPEGAPAEGEPDLKSESEKPVIVPVIRSDFRETAFFYPRLSPDKKGFVSIDFTVPDALTKWKFQALAHNEELQYGLISKEVVTLKKLMVVQNLPRFLTTGDSLVVSVRLSNLSEEELNGMAEIQIRRYADDQDMTQAMLEGTVQKAFKLDANANGVISWKIASPAEPGLLVIRNSATAGTHTDGEERIIPVITDRQFVTASLPFSLRAGKKVNLTFEAFNQVKQSSSAEIRRYVLEYTSNPAWYVVQALPYLASSGEESNEQVFNRFYANALGSYIVNRHPEIEKTFRSWQDTTSQSLISNLEKNEDLKTTVLNETPWLLEGKSESEQKHNIATFFDRNNIEQNQIAALRELLNRQSPNGGWPWFPGMPEDRFMTQHIVTGFGRLYQQKVEIPNLKNELNNALKAAIRYTDQKMLEEYQHILSHPGLKKNPRLNHHHVQYLYARSYFPENILANQFREAHSFFVDLARKQWLSQNKYLQAMLALYFNRTGDVEMAGTIMTSLTETAINNEESGMYWKRQNGWYWYQSDIESQSVLIEAFDEVKKAGQDVEALKTWLIKQKQTHLWKTRKATIDACYAVLMRGNNVLSESVPLQISLANTSLYNLKPGLKPEAGSGYVKTDWKDDEIKQDFDQLTVQNNNNAVAWGAAYIQYFEKAENVVASGNALTIERKIYILNATDAGIKMTEVKDGMKVKVGDKLRIRLIISTDREMEYVHISDHRAAGFEPVDVRSGYSYKNGLSIYQSIRDAAHHFYVGRLSMGTYTLEYDVRVNNKGSFTTGISTIQCQYAPEFNAVGTGQRILAD